MNDKISVIIPTYKRYDLLERAIKSVIKQSYKNLEIIVVDDNANFPEIRKKTEEIVKRYPKIIYIKNKKNIGGGPTRNVGIKRATSKYLVFLDDDDEFLPEKIEKQYNLFKSLRNDKIGMIYCYVDNYDESGKFISTNKKDFEGCCLYEHLCYFVATTSCWFCPKKVLEDVGMFDDIPSQQDTTLLLKMLGMGYEVYRVPEVLLKWYFHDKNSGITTISDAYIQNIKSYQDLARIYYNKLSKSQIRSVEYRFHNQLCNLYMQNKNKKEAYLEISKMFKIFPWGARVYNNLFKIMRIKK